VCEPLIASQDEYIKWRAPKFDLAELARLRWLENWSRKALAERFGKTEPAIQQHFHKLKVKDFRVDGLNARDRVEILRRRRSRA
jgi:hypothetical protein